MASATPISGGTISFDNSVDVAGGAGPDTQIIDADTGEVLAVIVDQGLTLTDSDFTIVV